MEYITNGDFAATPFDDGWVNPYMYHAFTEDAGKAKATVTSNMLKMFDMRQSFVLPVTVIEVLTAALAGDTSWSNAPGSDYAEFIVDIVKPSAASDNVYSTIHQGVGAGSEAISENVLATFDEVDGTYYIRLRCNVGSASSTINGWFDNISLVLTVKHSLTFAEVASPTEFLLGVPRVPLPSEQEMLLVGLDDTKIYVFQDGTPEGTYETDDIDFGLMGQEKVLERVIALSHAEAPHTVQVYYSTDSGASWTAIGAVTLQKGLASIIHTWVNAEKFRLRFKGDGLHLVSWEVQAILEGPQEGDD